MASGSARPYQRDLPRHLMTVGIRHLVALMTADEWCRTKQYEIGMAWKREPENESL
jgi:hypothetical protein